MSDIKITPELLADVEAKAKSCRPGDTLHFDPAVVLAMTKMITGLCGNKPNCLHWWSEEDHEWKNCKDGNGRDEHNEPYGFCPDCGGEVEVIENPFTEGGAE